MSSYQEFREAADKVHKLKNKPTNEELLEIYGLFKQAEVGDVNSDRPGFMDFKGQAKWDAWNSRKGMSTEDAYKEYVYISNQLIEKYGVN